jgi:hypothetical protein
VLQVLPRLLQAQQIDPQRVGASSTTFQILAHSSGLAPGQTTARSISERSSWSPRAREPNRTIFWIAGQTAELLGDGTYRGVHPGHARLFGIDLHGLATLSQLARFAA